MSAKFTASSSFYTAYVGNLLVCKMYRKTMYMLITCENCDITFS